MVISQNTGDNVILAEGVSISVPVTRKRGRWLLVRIELGSWFKFVQWDQKKIWFSASNNLFWHQNEPFQRNIRLKRKSAGEITPALNTGAEGQNRTADKGIFRPNFWNSENTVITSSWFYSNFSSYFWFRLEQFGNIWPWRAQFGHNPN